MNADALDIRLLRFRSKRDEAPHSLASDLLDADRVSEALEVVHAGLLDAEDDPALLVLEGRAWFAEGDLPQAQAALLRAAKVQPNHADAYRWLSQVLMKRGEPKKAVKVLERAAKLRPDDADLASALARARRLSHIAEQADSGRLSQPPPPQPEPATPPAALAPEPARVPAPGPAASRPPIAKPAVERGRPAAASRPAASDPAAISAPPAASRPPAPKPAAIPAPPAAARPPASPAAQEQPRLVPPAARAAQPPSAAEASSSSRPQASARPPQEAAPRPRAAELSLHEDSLVHALVDSSEVSVDEPPFLEDEDTGRHTPAGFEFEEERPTAALPVPDEEGPTLGWSQPPPAPDEEAPTTLSQPPAAPSEEAPTRVSQPAIPAAPAREAFAHDSVETFDEASGVPLDEDRGADESFEPAYVASPEQAAASTPAASIEPPADVATGQRDPEQPESPERVIEVVREQGLFEEAGGTEAAWASRSESRREGTRSRTGLAIGWAAALLLSGGGYYGWERWVEHRHTQAAELVGEVRTALAGGQWASRVEAEATLGRARQLDPRAEGVDRMAVLLQSAHAIEDGELDVGYLRPALSRLEKISNGSLVGQLAAGIIGLSSGTPAPAAAALKVADEGQLGAEERYLASALALRLGTEDAIERLEQAAKAQGVPRSVFLQGAAHSAVAGDDAQALAWLQRGQEAGLDGLRVDLWQALLAPQPAGDALAGLEGSLAAAATTDRLLFRLATARAEAAQGDGEAAAAAVREATALPVRDPQLLALLARVASEVGAHDTAHAAARGALQTAPQNAAYRDAMVRALLGRGDGEAVERALSNAPADAPWVVVARARSALLTGDREALGQADAKLTALTEQDDDADLAALRLRVELRLGKSPRALLGRAKKLAHRAGESGRVQLALGESALAARDARTAVEALEKARAQLSDSGELLEQLARAYRLSGQPDKARQAFERAVQVAPELTVAKAELARIALAEGDYATAEKGFAQVTDGEQASAAKLGRVEALLGLGRLLDARELLSALPAEVQEGAEARVLETRLLLLSGEQRKAEDLAEDLLEEGGRTAPHLTLYGDVLFADDEVDKAAGAYDAALEEDADYPEALVGRARAAVRAEKTSQAYGWLDEAEQALQEQTRPPSVRARLLTYRGMAQILDRRFEEARASLESAVALAGVPAEAYFWLGEAQALTKQAGARESYERYLSLEPEGDLARRAHRALKPR